MQYLRNGVVFYMSTIVPAYPLLVDSTLYSTAATPLTNATVSGNWQTPLPPTGEAVVWTNAMGVTVLGGSLTKTAVPGLECGGSVEQAAGVGGWVVTFTASETNTYRMLG